MFVIMLLPVKDAVFYELIDKVSGKVAVNGVK